MNCWKMCAKHLSRWIILAEQRVWKLPASRPRVRRKLGHRLTRMETRAPPSLWSFGFPCRNEGETWTRIEGNSRWKIRSSVTPMATLICTTSARPKPIMWKTYTKVYISVRRNMSFTFNFKERFCTINPLYKTQHKSSSSLLLAS